MKSISNLYNCTDLNGNSTLNREAAKISGLSEEEIFTMANFTYENSVVVSQMFKHVNNTLFSGISVSMNIESFMFTCTNKYK